MTQTLAAVLVIDDEPRSVEAISRALEDDFEPFGATGAAAAWPILEREDIAAIVCDQKMP